MTLFRKSIFVCLSVLAGLSANPRTAAAATLDVARSHHAAGRFREAMAAYRSFLAEPETEPGSQAVARNNLCVLLDQFGDHTEAVSECRIALELRRSLGDEARTGRTLNNLGLALQHSGRYDDAHRAFTEARETNSRLGDGRALAINLANLGGLATSRGRYAEALALHERAERLAVGSGGEPWAEEQIRVARINRGVVLERLGAHRQALDLYRSLLDEQSALPQRERASVLVNAGVLYRNLGDPIKAAELFENAIILYEKMGDLSGKMDVVLNLAIAADLNLGQTERAEREYRRALDLARATGDPADEVEVLAFLGRLLLREKRLAEAESAFSSALEVARAAGSPEGLWSAEAGLGRVALARAEPELARQRFDSALARVEATRAKVVAPAHRASYFADKRVVFDGAALTLAILHGDEPRAGHAAAAHQIAQRAKARDLFDALGTGSGPEAALTPAELGSRLGRDVLVEYLMTSETLLAWRISADSLVFSDLGPSAAIHEAIDRLQSALRNGRPPAAADLDFLSKRLAPSLGSPPARGGRLIIASDGFLHQLPFGLLRRNGGDSTPLVDGAPLAYLPSAWALSEPRRLEVERGLLGFGDLPSEPSNAPAALGGWRRELALEPLPATRTELEDIGRQLGGKHAVWTRENATERRYREEAAKGARVLHFATHTILAAGYERRAAIVLMPADGDDGLLHPEEIAASPISTTLTVLAACSTGMTTPRDGRALGSLAGAFLAAGSQAVVATLWDVGDQPTAVFMQQFYHQLARGLPPSQALRQAKLALRSDPRWTAPHLWSGYVLIGTGPPVSTRRPLVWWLLAFALGLAAVTVVARRRRR